MRRFAGGRSTLWTLLIAIAAVLVGTLLLLAALGYLAFPTSSAPSYVVTGARIILVEGTTSNGQGWFGPNPTNLTGPPFPLEVSPGATFTLTWTFSNFDGKAHTVSSISVAAPFALVSVTPTVPSQVPPYIDSGAYLLTLRAPSSPGGSGEVVLTVDAL
jgi:hypothetical protein